MAVYFIRPVGMAGPVKIGMAKCPESRLYELHAVSPLPLEIVARIDGNHSTEMRFHARFEHLHSHREWFRADAAIDAVIADINAGTFDVESLPKALRITKTRWWDTRPLAVAA